MPDISSLNGGIPKPTPSLTDKLPVQEVGGVTVSVTVASLIALASGGGGLAAWQLKTADYTAIAGDRLRIDASSGNVVITMPSPPSAIDADIWIQRLDTSPNLVLIRTGVDKLNGQSGKDGVFAPSPIQVIERLSYVNPVIGWLGQFDRLTYQNQPISGSSSLLLHFDGANNSTVFTDSSVNAIALTTIGTPTISTVQSKFGGSSLYLPGGSAIQVTDTPALEFLTNDFTIEFWQDLTTTGYILGKGNALNAPGSAISWSYALGFDFYCNSGTLNYTLSTPSPASGVMRHIAITRQSTEIRYFIDGVLTSSLSILATASINNVTNPLQLGAYGPGSVVGYIDEFIIDIGVARYTTNFTPPTSPRVS